MFAQVSSTLFALSLLSAAQAAPGAQVSTSLPKDASEPVDKQFMAFGIETTSFPLYTGSKDKPNTFSLNLFDAIHSRTGVVSIRVGGTSGDNAFWNATQQDAIYFPKGDHGLQSKMSLGQDWMDSFKLVKGARYDLVVPLENRNLSNAVTFAQDWYKTVGSDGFGSFEIGNEPNEYWFKGADGKKYDVQDYVQQWEQWVNAIRGNITDLPKAANFWALSTSITDPDAWKVKPAFEDGFSKDVDEIQAVSQHYYQTLTFGKGTTLQHSLLNHTGTKREMSNKYADQISYLKQNTNGKVPLFLGETANAMGNGTGSPYLQASLGSAVWSVDFMLNAMAMGIGRVNMQMIAKSPFSGWQPVPITNVSHVDADGVVHTNLTIDKQVLGTFYGEVLVADLIGSAKGKLRVKELDVADAKVGNSSIAAYATYDDDKLSKVVLLNEDLWEQRWGTARPKTEVTVSGLGDGFKTATVEYMTGVSGGTHRNMSWAGQAWTVESDGKPVSLRNDTIVIDVKNGAVSVPIQSTEVAVLCFQGK